MAKLRHVAINCEDVEASAKFFREAFELEEVGRRGSAIYLSDGIVNVAMIKIADPNFPNYRPLGINHIGFLVDDLDAAVAHVQEHGATVSISVKDQQAHAEKAGVKGPLHEVKMRGPTGVAFDLSHIGWPGAVA